MLLVCGVVRAGQWVCFCGIWCGADGECAGAGVGEIVDSGGGAVDGSNVDFAGDF